MIIYISMLVVVFVGYILHIYLRDNSFYTYEPIAEKHGTKYAKINENRARPLGESVSNLEVFLVFGYIIFWVGIRDAFVDTAAYIREFNECSFSDISSLDLSFGSGWGFYLIQILFKTCISSNYHVWLMFIAIVSGACIALTFKRYSGNYFFSVFLFLATTNFTWLMNGIRQFVVVCIIFACTPLIEKKKWLPYCIIVLLCSTIHFTCLMMIPIYFIVQAKPWKWQTVAVLLLVVAVIASTSTFVGALDTMLEDTKYANSSEKFVGDDGVNPIRVLVYAITPILAFIAKKIFAKEHDKRIDIMVNMSIITAAVYAVGMVTSGILIGRLPMYAQMYEYMLLPIIFNKCFENKSKAFMYAMCTLGFLVYFYIMSKGFYYSCSFTGRLY